MQAHAVDSAPSRGGKASGSKGGGILAPLLQSELDDLPPPPPAALIGIRVSKLFGRFGTFEGQVLSYDHETGFRVQARNAHSRAAMPLRSCHS